MIKEYIYIYKCLKYFKKNFPFQRIPRNPNFLFPSPQTVRNLETLLSALSPKILLPSGALSQPTA